MGADPDDDNGNSGNSGENSGNQNNQGGQGDSGQNQNSGGQGNQNNQSTDDDDDDPYKGLTAKELKKLLSDAENDNTKTAAELQQLRDAQTAAERKKNDENTNLKADVASRDKTIAQLRSALAEQAITGGIRDDKRFEWHNPKVVAQQFNSGEVTVDDDGKVTGLTKALARIAKDESCKFMLAKDNTQQQDDQNNQNNNQQQQNNGPSGFQPGQGGSNSSGSGITENYDELVKIMPALRTREGVKS
jgi:hypothetical protein